MKMFKSVFQFPNYGMNKFYEMREEAKTLLSKRKGKTKKVREELRAKSQRELQIKQLEESRNASARVIEISNKSVKNK
jgi:LPS O-antigen subunit length determinant protein (WzzB/FepE family)